MMKDTYKTIGEPSEGIYKDRKSRFISYAYPVCSEDEIKQHLGNLRKTHHDASHHCFAWRLEADMKRFRCNDDGEPAGSAGNPILGQIRSRNLTNILVVVIRYFGGTLLGVGGLINAYRTASADALDRATILQKKVFSRWTVRFGYPQMDPVMRLIKEYGLVPEEQQFDLECKLTLPIWRRSEKQVLERLHRIEGCSLELVE